MSSRSTVFDLARQLLRVGDRAVLDSPLEQLSSQAQSEAARDALRDLAAAGFAATLREALEDDRLDRFAAESCTQREEEALCRMLSGLLGGGPDGIGDDDPARLVSLQAPPLDAEALRAWALHHGVEEPWQRANGEADAATSPLQAQDRLDQLRGRLLAAARRRAASSARRQLWRRPAADPSLDTLLARLRALLAGTQPEDLAPWRFVPAHPVTLDEADHSAAGLLHWEGGETCRVRLFLGGFEHRGLIGDCERCGEGVCVHVRALGGRVLDAALAPEDRLHGGLRQVTSQPSWQHFVAALAPQATAQQAPQAQDQLSFQLEHTGARLAVSALLHKATRSGGLSAGRRLPIARAARAPAATEVDRAVLDAMALGSRPLSTRSVPADPSILRALSAHPRVHWAEGGALVRVVETRVRLELLEQADGLLPQVSLGGSPLPRRMPPEGLTYLLHRDVGGDCLYFCPLSPPVRRLLAALSSFRGVLPPESFEALAPQLSELRLVAQVSAPAALNGMEHPPRRKLLLRLSAGIGDSLHLTLSARPLPLGALWPPGMGPQVVHGLLDGAPVHGRRDLDWERITATQVLQELDLRSHIRIQAFEYRVEERQPMLTVLAAAARLSDVLELEWSARVRRLTVAPSIQTQSLNVRLCKKGHWLELEGQGLSGEQRVAVGRLFEAVRRGERFVRVEGDSYAEIEEALYSQLDHALACVMDARGTPRLPSVAAPYFTRGLGKGCEPADAETRAFLARVADANTATAERAPPLPTAVGKLLRSYQRAGFDWLWRLSTWAPGACLADEMGLGKTIQAIALLTARASQGPALVVAPTSVVPNWHAELDRFGKPLKVLQPRGGKSLKLPTLGPGDVVITSYDLLLRHQARFAEQDFATQVIDEAQWIKNARTQRAKAVAAVRADFRLALSGTPVENRLGDLWSLFGLIAPGLLGSWARFRAIFAVPIERYQNRERSAALRQLVAPFILRRTKQQVAQELPSRTEVVHRIELSQAERDLYEAATAEARDTLRKRRAGDAVRTTHVLSDLTRLRQLACHPQLVVRQSDVRSSKLAALQQLLQDILPRGHRVLLFSQFVQHLLLVQHMLRELGIHSLYLDGSTPAAERPGLVAAFQRGEASVFLISLKAGGAGLNLTAADYVIHLDPWWNPAAEDQASDRAHRLGQVRPVTIVKLVAANTIEERVLALHAHKRELSDDLLHDRELPVPLNIDLLEGLLGQASPPA